MPVTAIRLQNFMAFEDTGWIELRPITLLFGRNSSGKSAIFRALRLLKQSLSTHADEGPLRFNDEDGIDLGGFTEMIHRQDESRPLKFGFRCEPLVHLRAIRDIAASSPQVVRQTIALDSDWAELELSFVLGSDKQVQLSGVILSAQSAERSKAEHNTVFAASHLPAELSRLVANNEWYFTSDSVSSPSGETPDDLWTGIELTTASGFFPRLTRSEVRAEKATALQKERSAIQSLLDEMRKEIKEFLSTLAFMDAIRPEPQRVYTFNRSTQRFWEARGLHAFLAFLSGKLSTDILAEADRWLARLDLGAEVRASRRPSKDDLLLEFQVQLRESASEFTMNLRDVGAGAGQVLPIIVQAIAAEPGVVIASEQPELHLHPRAQADLADLFVQTALRAFTAPDNPRTDRREGTAISYLIETHSEHLILRLQRRIREGLLPPDYLKVFYIVRDKGVSHCHDLRIDHEGDFVDRWPEGFFEERYAELFATPRLT